MVDVKVREMREGAEHHVDLVDPPGELVEKGPQFVVATIIVFRNDAALALLVVPDGLARCENIQIGKSRDERIAHEPPRTVTHDVIARVDIHCNVPIHRRAP